MTVKMAYPNLSDSSKLKTTGRRRRQALGSALAALAFLTLLSQPPAIVRASSPQAPPPKEQENWIARQFQRFRSYPHLERAYRLMQENKPGEARAELERYLSLTPGDRTARTNYLLLLYQMKDYAAAAREVDRLLAEKPEGVLYLYRALVREHTRKTALALEDYLRAAGATDIKPADKTRALDQAADLAIALKKPDTALEALKTLGESSFPYRFQLRKGMALEMQSQPQKAGQAYDVAAGSAANPEDKVRALRFAGEAFAKAGDWDRAQRAFEQVLAAKPGELHLLRSLGQVTFKAKRFADSIRYTRQALLLEDNSAERERLVFALRESGNPAEAEHELDALMAKKGSATGAPLYLLKGELALAQKRTQDAEAAFRQVLRREPRNAQALRSMSKIAKDRKEFLDSIHWMERIPVERRLPGDIESLASSYLADGKPRSAIFLYRRLLEQGYRQDSRYTLLLQLGEAYRVAGRFAEAGKVFAQAVKLRPAIKSVEALVQSLLKSGQKTRALEAINHVAGSRVSPEDRTTIALLYVQAGNDTKALEQLSFALKGAPAAQLARRAHSQRGFIYRRKGMLAEARKDFEAALRLGADDAEVNLALGETCLALKDFERAKSILKAQEAHRGGTEIRLLLAQAYEGAGNPNDALSLYRTVAAGSTISPAQALSCLTSIAGLEARLGHPADAAGHYLQAYEKSGRKDWRLLSDAFQSLVAAGQWEDAESTGARLLALPSLPPSSAAGIWEQRAYISLRLNNPEKAVEYFRNALAAGRDDWNVHQMLGLVLYEQGRKDQALESFLASLKRREAAPSMVYAGRCYRDLGQPQEALSLFQRALTRSTELTGAEQCEVWKEVGYLQFSAPDYESAAAAWEQSLRCEPDPVLSVKRSKALRLAGQIKEAEEALPRVPPENATAAQQAEYFEEQANLLRAGSRGREAIAALTRAQELAPESSREYQLGEWCRSAGEPEQALVHFRRAVEQDGANALYRASLGYALLAEEKYDEAAAQFEAALQADPDRTNLYRQLGYTYMRESRNRDAARSFTRSLERESLLTAQSPEEMRAVRREMGLERQEVEKLDNRFDLTVYLAQSSDKRELPPAPPVLILGAIPSSAGVELDYTPPGIGLRNERIFQIFGRVLGNMRPGTLDPDPESYQAGAGVRYKPLRTENFFLSGEKIFGLNNSYANNWLLRGLYSKDWGYGLKPGYGRWNYTLFYGDLGLFMKQPRYLIGYGELRQGISFNLNDALVITPHVLAAGRFYELNEIADPYVEGGGGVSFKFYLRHGEYRLRRASFEFLLHYRGGRVFAPASVTGKRTYSGLAGTAILTF